MPILNKIDLPSAHPDEVAQEVEDVIGLPCLDAPRVSAKTGLNVDQVLERVVTDIPAPTGDPDAPLKALIFDSIYDSYKGVIVYIRVFEGTVKPGDTIKMMATGAEFTLVEVGHMGATLSLIHIFREPFHPHLIISWELLPELAVFRVREKDIFVCTNSQYIQNNGNKRQTQSPPHPKHIRIIFQCKIESKKSNVIAYQQ